MLSLEQCLQLGLTKDTSSPELEAAGANPAMHSASAMDGATIEEEDGAAATETKAKTECGLEMGGPQKATHFESAGQPFLQRALQPAMTVPFHKQESQAVASPPAAALPPAAEEPTPSQAQLQMLAAAAIHGAAGPADPKFAAAAYPSSLPTTATAAAHSSASSRKQPATTKPRGNPYAMSAVPAAHSHPLLAAHYYPQGMYYPPTHDYPIAPPCSPHRTSAPYHPYSYSHGRHHFHPYQQQQYQQQYQQQQQLQQQYQVASPPSQPAHRQPRVELKTGAPIVRMHAVASGVHSPLDDAHVSSVTDGCAHPDSSSKKFMCRDSTPPPSAAVAVSSSEAASASALAGKDAAESSVPRNDIRLCSSLPAAGHGSGGGDLAASMRAPFHPWPVLAQRPASRNRMPPPPPLCDGPVGSTTRLATETSASAMAPLPVLEEQVRMDVSEFVLKVYRMLCDPSSQSIVSWSSDGESFVVHDPIEFAKKLLPRHFRHNNFSSFVRQLNKYSFHKVKQREDRGTRSAIWEFQHAFFQRGRLDLLSRVRRKCSPSGTKSSGNAASLAAAAGSGMCETSAVLLVPDSPENNGSMHPVDASAPGTGNPAAPPQTTLPPTSSSSSSSAEPKDTSSPQLTNRVQSLEESCGRFAAIMGVYGESVQTLASEVLSIRKHMMVQDQILLEWIGQHQKTSDTMNVDGAASPEPASISFLRMFSQQAALSTAKLELVENELARTTDVLQQFVRRHAGAEPAIASVSPTHLAAVPVEPPIPSTSVPPPSSVSNPNSWAVSPRILLVEDDAVCRRLSSRILQLSGCMCDVAEDGMDALKKMNSVKYDLVLMDIVMPNLDGVTATHHIRKFDQCTPIISMTCNTSEQDCLTYMATGMNDILPKPFTKAHLLTMLNRYCSHLGKQWEQQQQQQQGGEDGQLRPRISISPSPPSSCLRKPEGSGLVAAEEPVPSDATFASFFTQFVSPTQSTPRLLRVQYLDTTSEEDAAATERNLAESLAPTTLDTPASPSAPTDFEPHVSSQEEHGQHELLLAQPEGLAAAQGEMKTRQNC